MLAPLRALDIREERRLAGVMAGILYLTGAVTVVILLFLPGGDTGHSGVVIGAAGIATAWGLACLFLIPWDRAQPLVSHFSSFMGFPIVAIVVASTGGATSPARFYLFFTLVYAAYFYRPREAFPYFAMCLVVHSLPLFYDDNAVHAHLPGELVVAGATYFALGGLILAGKSLMVDLREQALELSLHDSLTGLYNRRALMQLLERHVGGKRATDVTGLLIVDLDEFKEANTLFGHPGGDQVLKETAAALLATARGDDMVARLGGDEFAIVARGVDREVMDKLAQRLIQSVRRKDEELGLDGFHLRASCGWALYPADADNVDELMAAADAALRAAKESGKDRTSSWPDLIAD